MYLATRTRRAVIGINTKQYSEAELENPSIIQLAY